MEKKYTDTIERNDNENGGTTNGKNELDIYKLYDAIAKIIGHRENVTIRFNIRKRDEE